MRSPGSFSRYATIVRSSGRQCVLENMRPVEAEGLRRTRWRTKILFGGVSSRRAAATRSWRRPTDCDLFQRKYNAILCLSQSNLKMRTSTITVLLNIWRPSIRGKYNFFTERLFISLVQPFGYNVVPPTNRIWMRFDVVPFAQGHWEPRCFFEDLFFFKKFHTPLFSKLQNITFPSNYSGEKTGSRSIG